MSFRSTLPLFWKLLSVYLMYKTECNQGAPDPRIEYEQNIPVPLRCCVLMYPVTCSDTSKSIILVYSVLYWGVLTEPQLCPVLCSVLGLETQGERCLIWRPSWSLALARHLLGSCFSRSYYFLPPRKGGGESPSALSLITGPCNSQVVTWAKGFFQDYLVKVLER